jgi:hypothetical protein
VEIGRVKPPTIRIDELYEYFSIARCPLSLVPKASGGGRNGGARASPAEGARRSGMDEDDRPRAPSRARKLEEMSIDALEAYLDELEAEKERVREAIAEKLRVRAGAEGLFKR